MVNYMLGVTDDEEEESTTPAENQGQDDATGEVAQPEATAAAVAAEDRDEKESHTSSLSENRESYLKLGKQEASYEPDMIIDATTWWADEADPATPEPNLLYTELGSDEEDRNRSEDEASDFEEGETAAVEPAAADEIKTGPAAGSQVSMEIAEGDAVSIQVRKEASEDDSSAVVTEGAVEEGNTGGADVGSGEEDPDGPVFKREPLVASYDPRHVCLAEYWWAEGGDIMPRPLQIWKGENESQSDRKSVTAERAHQWCVENVYNNDDGRESRTQHQGRRSGNNRASGLRRSRSYEDDYDPYKINDAHKWFQGSKYPAAAERNQGTVEQQGPAPGQYFQLELPKGRPDDKAVQGQERRPQESPVPSAPQQGSEQKPEDTRRHERRESIKASVRVREVYKVPKGSRGSSVDRVHSKIHKSSKK